MVFIMLTYTISFDIDIDECAGGTHNCQQLCNNTVGSYACSCNSGYRIASNSRNCIGQLLNMYLP